VEDVADFDTFVITRTPVLLRFAYVLAGDTGLAEDLLQEALVKVHKRWATVCRADRPEAYVRRVLINEYTSWRRLRRNTESPTAQLPDLVPLGAVEAAVAERDVVWRALQRLPRRQRAALVLRYYEDLPDPDIARIIGCSTGTVRSLISRALQSLRRASGLESVVDGPSIFATGREHQ
jgi:RNA polymerase sigma-70 factor (sigma-E family)